MLIFDYAVLISWWSPSGLKTCCISLANSNINNTLPWKENAIRERPFNTLSWKLGGGKCVGPRSVGLIFFLDPEGVLKGFFRASLANIFNQYYKKDVFLNNKWISVYLIYELRGGRGFLFLPTRGELNLFCAKGGCTFFRVDKQQHFLTTQPPTPAPVLNGRSLIH